MGKLTFLSPSEYEKDKKNKTYKITYGFHKCPFGECLVGLLDEKICHLSFVSKSEEQNLRVLRRQWLGANLICDQSKTERIVEKIFNGDPENLEISLKGTPFQIKVWQALLKIPKGSTRCYEDIAIMINQRRAVRAVANAVAKNPVCYLIPCHRVIRKKGDPLKYRWKSDIKQKLLKFEKFNLK